MDDKNPARGAVVVTGVSTGIGRAIAEDLMAAGYTVLGSVRRPEDAAPLSTAFGSRFVPLVFDVTDAEALSAAVQTVHLQGDGLRALVNNAGIGLNGPLAHQPIEDFRKTFEVNVFGVLAVTRAFLPLLGTTARPGTATGRIVNIGSVQGAMTVPFMGAYSASKHALEALSQGLRRELIPYGIEVSTIEPSFIRSSLFEKSAAAWQRQRYEGTAYAEPWAQFNRALQQMESQAKPPQKVTRAVRHAIESRRPRTRYPLDGIWYVSRWLSDRAFDKLILRALGLHRSLRAVARSAGTPTSSDQMSKQLAADYAAMGETLKSINYKPE